MGRSNSRRERPTPKLKKESVRGGDNGHGGVAPNTHVNRPNDSRYCL
jgi:hypothetical protein